MVTARVLTAAALVLALGAAGCGSSGSSSSSSGSSGTSGSSGSSGSSGPSSSSPGSSGSSTSSASASTPSTSQGVNPNGPEVSPSGDIPDNQAYVLYSPPSSGYAVKVPEGWARTAGGGAVTFTDKLNSVRMESAPAGAAPTVGTVKQTDLPKLAQSVPGFQAVGVSSQPRKAGTAIRIRYLANSKPDQVTGKVTRDAVERYIFFHNGKAVMLTLSGPKGADNVDPWRIVTDSLRWTR